MRAHLPCGCVFVRVIITFKKKNYPHLLSSPKILDLITDPCSFGFADTQVYGESTHSSLLSHSILGEICIVKGLSSEISADIMCAFFHILQRDCK